MFKRMNGVKTLLYVLLFVAVTGTCRAEERAVTLPPEKAGVSLGEDFRDNFWDLGKEFKVETKVTQGDAAALKFHWKFLDKPLASRLTDGDLRGKNVAMFTPDAYGRYHIQLTVEDGGGSQSHDDKWVILYRFPGERPRLAAPRLAPVKAAFQFPLPVISMTAICPRRLEAGSSEYVAFPT